jgi:glycopeptide antibiotics resistance protein
MPIAPSARRALAIVLVCYSALLALALLAPSSGTQSSMATWVRDLGITLGFSAATATQQRAEFLCNVALLAPVAALGSLLWERTTWRDWTAFGFLVAGSVELAQGVFLPDRTASFADVVANTLGCLLGAVFIAVVSPRRTAAGTRPTTRE